MRAGRTGGEQLLVFDTTVLNHFALAERLDVLADLIIDRVCATTAVVLDELHIGAERPTGTDGAPGRPALSQRTGRRRLDRRSGDSTK